MKPWGWVSGTAAGPLTWPWALPTRPTIPSRPASLPWDPIPQHLVLKGFSHHIFTFSPVTRHLDSSSNERPDISSIQRRIKVPIVKIPFHPFGSQRAWQPNPTDQPWNALLFLWVGTAGLAKPFCLCGCKQRSFSAHWCHWHSWKAAWSGIGSPSSCTQQHWLMVLTAAEWGAGTHKLGRAVASGSASPGVPSWGRCWPWARCRLPLC